MVNPIYQQDEELLLNPFGSKYLPSGTYTDVNSNQFVVQEDAVISVLTGGDASIAENSIDYKASMSLSGVTLKRGALIVAPVGEAFKSITIDSGSIMAYNCVKPGFFVGLLDLYPNASAAYSLRKLRADYEGDAIEVRRSVGIPSNQSIGFNSDGELDTVALLAFVGSGDGFVVTWYDQSGGGNDATQGSASAQPQIVNSGSINLENGEPCAVFDGVNDYLESQNGFNEPIASFVSVYKNYQNDNTRPFGVRDTLGGSNKNTFAITPTNVLVFDGAFLAGSIAATISQKITYAQKSTTNAKSYINGVENNNSSIALNNTIGLFNIGNAHGALGLEFNGSFQMGIFYPTDQSANRVGIETNINKHYNIYWDGSQAGLLDGYPNAAAAYSLRALNSSYTGPAITVRRSSDNTEQDIRLLYNGELDTEGLLSFVGAGDGFVTAWYDQSGEGNNTIQSSDSSQPKIVSNGSLITKGGVVAIDFDGVNDDLRITTPVLNEINISHFSVSSSNNTETIGTVLCQSHTTVETIRVFNDSRSTPTPPRNLVVTALPTTYVNSGMSVARVNTNQRLLSSFIDSSKNMAAYDNGATGGTDTYVGSVTASNGLTIGSQAGLTYLNGKVQEIILYNSNQSANRTAIETNINNFYNVY